MSVVAAKVAFDNGSAFIHETTVRWSCTSRAAAPGSGARLCSTSRRRSRLPDRQLLGRLGRPAPGRRRRSPLPLGPRCRRDADRVLRAA